MATTATALQPAIDMIALEESIRLRAYELYTQRGGESGSEVEDWLKAEAEIRGTADSAADDAIDEASQESFPASDPPAL